MWPSAPSKLVNEFCGFAPDIFSKYGLNSDRRLKHFMGQISHESGGGSLPHMRESMFYTHAERLCEVWPTRFHSIAEATPYLRNEKALARKVYNGRMGNRPDTDDGYDFRGGGFLQNTGREMYAKLSKLTGIDLIGNPGLIDDTATNIRCAVIEFTQPATLAAADRDDTTGVTRCINGGTIGLKERMVWTAKWGRVLTA
jgi:putative chitinase